MTDKLPKWLDKAVFYEIYPQSFKDSNADGIGDINGIMQKLDYIRDLGCTAIWINPCYVSPFADAGYDVADYYQVAPRYGTNEDIKRLFVEAHKRDMHILLDLVPGHTSIEHPWFKESMKAQRNEYSDRYIWTDSIWEKPDGYSTIRGISKRDGSCIVNFFSTQPALNYGFHNPDPDKKWQKHYYDEEPKKTVAAIIDIMRFWLEMGCDGFRVDMAGSLVKGDTDAEDTIKIWQQIRSFLARDFPDAAMISEWGEPDKSIRGGFHMDFLLHFGPSHYNDLFRCHKPYFGGEGDASEFVKKYMESYVKTDRKGLICIPSGNHDMERLSRYIKGEKLKIAFAFLLTMPGAPFIYYGDEIGMRYIEGLVSVEGGYNRTGARSPMQWDDSKNAGFGDSAKEELYIQQDESADRPTVKSALADNDSLLNEIKRLIALRNRHEALQSKGEIDFVYCEKDKYPLAYIRSSNAERLLVVLNPSDKAEELLLDCLPQELVYVIGRANLCEKGLSIDADSFAVFRL